MLKFIEWIGVPQTVKDIWCVGCRARRTVRRIEVLRDGRQGSRRLVGRCKVCDGITSTYIR